MEETPQLMSSNFVK